MKTHECPYLENGQFCSHKEEGLRRNKCDRRHCGYPNPEHCRLYIKSKSVFTMLKNAFKPHIKGDVRV